MAHRLSRRALLLGALVGLAAAAAVDVRLPIGPLRKYWPEEHGFCGEVSLQQICAYYGCWLSQRAARWLAGGEVLISELEGQNMRPLMARTLGFNKTFFRRPADEQGAREYVLWLKQAVAANRTPAVLAYRIHHGESREPYAYDHLVTLYGASFTSLTDYDPADTLTWTTDTGLEITRGPSDPFFFADGPDDCRYRLAEGGCVNNNPDTYNYGAAIAGLPDERRVYLPLQLFITEWEDGTPPDEEPRDGRVLGSYALNLTRLNASLPTGSVLSLYRFNMALGRSVDDVIDSGRVLANPESPAAVHELCVRAGDACASASVVVGPPPGGLARLAAAHELLGPLPANSVVYFVALRAGPHPAITRARDLPYASLIDGQGAAERAQLRRAQAADGAAAARASWGALAGAAAAAAAAAALL